MIRKVKLSDAKDIVEIYNPYILNTNITFEEEPIDEEEMKKRILEKTANNPWIVYEENNKVIGYAYLSNWMHRSAFKYSKEISIYLDMNVLSKGIGTMLFKTLLEECMNYKIHSIVSGITIPNEKSVRLHEKFGFKNIATFYEIGYKNNEWLNVGYWQLNLK